MSRRHSSEIAKAKKFASKVASLLRGGLPTRQVFDALLLEEQADSSDTRGQRRNRLWQRSEESEEASVVLRVSKRLHRGGQVAHGLAAERHPVWRVLAAAWHAAEQTGAPFAVALDRIAHALTALEHIEHRRSVLLQGPKSTVVIVCALPVIAFFLGEMMGFRSIDQLTSPGGIIMLVVGVILLIAGIGWSTWMIRQIANLDRIAGLELDMLWIVLAAGHSPETGMVLVADSVDEVGAEWIPFASLQTRGDAMSTVRLARSTGAPVRSLLIIEADAVRARSKASLERAAEKLAVRVLIPLGLCILPAFIVAGVVPVIMSMVAPA